MDKNTILTILNDWNFWKNDLPTGIKRQSYLNQLKKALTTNQILVITGPRRAGKSYLMRQLAKDLMGGGIAKKDILMINFEDPRFPKMDAKVLQKIYETYLEFLSPVSKPTIFLDEVQEVDDWEKWVMTMQELNKAKIILSGSNATLLSKELATLLTGRHIKQTVFPLSFPEALLFHGIEIKDPLDVLNKRVKIHSKLREYFEFGSFPQVVLSSEKKSILLNYFEDVLSKDLVRRFKIRKTEALKSLARFYFSNAASLTTFNSIEKFLKISADTAERFSSHFEDAYLFFFLKRFSFKTKEQEKSPRKVYPVDTGLANAVGFAFSQNLGKLAETIIFLQLLRKKAQDPNLDIFYWKDAQHREVDFLVKEGLQVKQLIQVCWNITHPQTREREKRPLLKAMKELDLKEGIIITEEREEVEELGGNEIQYIPLFKWLLKN